MGITLGMILFLAAGSKSQQAQSATLAVNDSLLPGKTGTVVYKKKGEYIKVFLNNIPAVVLADFISRYEDPLIASWVIDEQQITANFRYDNESIFVVYQHGLLQSTQKTYDSTHTNAVLKHYLSDELKKGFRIHLVTEMISGTAVLYQVSLLSSQQVCILVFNKRGTGNLELDTRTVYNRVPADVL